jgi:hypothetical protein
VYCSGRSQANFIRAKHGLGIRQESFDLQGLIPRVDLLSFLPCSNDIPQQEQLMLKATLTTLMSGLMGW